MKKGGISVRISEGLINKAKIIKEIEKRSLNEQIEYWANMGRIALENPDLPIGFIKDLLISLKEADTIKLKPYKIGED